MGLVRCCGVAPCESALDLGEYSEDRQAAHMMSVGLVTDHPAQLHNYRRSPSRAGAWRCRRWELLQWKCSLSSARGPR